MHSSHLLTFFIYFVFTSYKLWYNYLKLRRQQVKGHIITDSVYEDVNNAFERSLVFMHKVRCSYFWTISVKIDLEKNDWLKKASSSAFPCMVIIRR